MSCMLRNIDVYSPSHRGKMDIWLVGSQIYQITSPGVIKAVPDHTEVIECDGLTALPGLINGEAEIQRIAADELLLNGITAIGGVLGAYALPGSMPQLLHRANVLGRRHLSCFAYTGGSRLPLQHVTGDIFNDIALVDRIIGVGTVSVADARVSRAGVEDLLNIATRSYMSSTQGLQRGLVRFRIGGDAQGKSILTELPGRARLLPRHFLCAEVNRDKKLLRQAAMYARQGGNIELSCLEECQVKASDAVKSLIDAGVDLGRVTIAGGCGENAESLLDALRMCVQKQGLPLELAVCLVTSNAARRMGKYPRIGTLSEGGNADLLVTGRNMELHTLFSKGKCVVKAGKPVGDQRDQ